MLTFVIPNATYMILDAAPSSDSLSQESPRGFFYPLRADEKIPVSSSLILLGLSLSTAEAQLQTILIP